MIRRARYVIVLLKLIVVSFANGSEHVDDYQVAVEQAARRYRIRAYHTYRYDRQKYDEQISLGRQVLQRWVDGGHRPDEANVVEFWFNRTTQTMGQPMAGNHAGTYEPITANRRNVPRELRMARRVEIPSAPAPTESSWSIGPQSTPLLRERTIKPADATSRPMVRAEPSGNASDTSTSAASSPVESIVGITDTHKPTNTTKTLFAEPFVVTSSSGPFSGSHHFEDPPINMDMLASRVSTHNADLLFFEVSLQQEENWTVRDLESLIVEIEDLRLRADLSRVYLDLLPMSIQDQVPTLKPIDAVVTVLQLRISQSHQSAEQRFDLVEASQLEQLSERIRKWTTAP